MTAAATGKRSEFHRLDQTGDRNRVAPLWRPVNATLAPYPNDKMVPGVLVEPAATPPAATAVIHGDSQVS